MAVEKIVTLCKEGDSTLEYYPNIKGDNIPVNAIEKTKLATALQDEIDGKAPQSTTYTKTEIDNKLSGKVNVATYNAKVSELETAIGTKANASDVYTKTATDTLLGAKANASTTYTKTETDTLLSAKANASDVYTKTETDTLLNGKQNALTTSSVNDGTIDKNIGFDSQGNIVKQTSSGGSQLYRHNISLLNNESNYIICNIINTSSTQYNLSTFTQYMASHFPSINNMLLASGYCSGLGDKITGIYYDDGDSNKLMVYGNDETSDIDTYITLYDNIETII